jgi:hypothetical protein
MLLVGWLQKYLVGVPLTLIDLDGAARKRLLPEVGRRGQPDGEATVVLHVQLDRQDLGDDVISLKILSAKNLAKNLATFTYSRHCYLNGLCKTCYTFTYFRKVLM